MVISTEPIYIVTDQDPMTGIGRLARCTAALLKQDFPALRLVNLGYRNPTFEGLEPGTLRLIKSKSPLASRWVSWKNVRTIRKSGVLNEKNVHLITVDFSLSDVSSRLIATVCDHYIRPPKMRDLLAGPIDAIREAHVVLLYTMRPRQIARARCVISISNETCNDLRRATGISSSVVYPWVDAPDCAGISKESARRRTGLPIDKHVLLNVGTPGMNKQGGILADIMDQLPRDFVLAKVGSALPHVERVRNFGRVDAETYSLLFRASDVYLHTSLKEGFGLPLLEALSTGLPIVAADVSTSREVLVDSGLLVSPSDPAAYVRAISAFSEPAVSLEYSLRGRKRAEAFAPDSARRAYIRAYKSSFNL